MRTVKGMTSDVGLEVTVTELFFMEAEACVVVEAVIVAAARRN